MSFVVKYRSRTSGGREIVRARTVESDTLKVGRSAECDIVLSDLGVTLAQLVSANNIQNEDIIEIGDALVIPGTAAGASPTTATDTTTTTESTAQTPSGDVVKTTERASATSTASSSETHTVATGDTIFGIALANELGWQELLDLNDLSENSILQIGQEIRLE